MQLLHPFKSFLNFDALIVIKAVSCYTYINLSMVYYSIILLANDTHRKRGFALYRFYYQK